MVKARESGNLSGFLGIVRGTPAIAVRGDIVFDDMLQRSVAAGDPIAFIGGTGARIGKDPSFNFALTMTRRTNDGPVVDEDALRQLFPAAFEVPFVSIEQDPPGKPTVTVDFGPTPPGATSPP